MVEIIIAITYVVSMICSLNGRCELLLSAGGPEVCHYKQYYRLITHGVIHSSVFHLSFNIIALYIFGKEIEKHYSGFVFLSFYVGAVVVSIVPWCIKNKDNYKGYATGASGAVSALLFAYIVLNWGQHLMWFSWLTLIDIVVGAAYLHYCYHKDKKGTEHYVNHSAHLYGGLFGIAFALLIK